MADIEILGLNGGAWYTVLVIAGMFTILLCTKIRTEIAFIAAIAALLLGGVLNEKEAIAGFSSNSVVVVGVLYIVIAGLTYTGVLNWIVDKLLGMPHTITGAILRLMFPVALLSSLLSNTTVVALFINVVKLWAQKLRISPSKLLIPLSYASCLGGICTLIGTPPNLIISGMYAESEGKHMSIFTTTIPGLVCLAVGVISIIALQKLLPTRKSVYYQANAEDFTAELHVPNDSHKIGKAFNEAFYIPQATTSNLMILGIRHFDGEYSSFDSDDYIMGGDNVIVSGKTQEIIRFAQNNGLRNDEIMGIMLSKCNEKNIGSKTVVSALIMLAMVLLSAFNIMPLLTSCILAALAMIIFRCCSTEQALQSINWNILIVFAGSVTIGKAIENTGLAEALANGLLKTCGTNPYVVLFSLCLIGTFITEFISNTAAGAIFCPIAISTSHTLGVNPVTFCVALMIAVSSSFATPIGSPTHLLVYGPGGYRFSDFLKIGVLMNIIILITNIVITNIVFPL